MEGTTLKSLTASSPPTDGSGDPKEVKLFFKKLWHSRLSPEECKDVGSMLHMLKLSPDQKKLFDTFKEKLGIPKSGVPQYSGIQDDITLFRFLSGKQWIIEDALNQYRVLYKIGTVFSTILTVFEQAMAKWREDEKIDKLIEWEEKNQDEIKLAEKLYPSCLCGDDKEGRPVVIARMGKIAVKEFIKSFSKEEWRMHHKWRVEKTIELLRKRAIALKKPIYQAIVLVDLEGMGFSFRHIMPYMKMTSQIDKQNYPETVSYIFLLNTPWVVPLLFKMLAPFIDPRTKEKIQASSGTPDLAHEVMDAKVLPAAWGGENQIELPVAEVNSDSNDNDNDDGLSIQNVAARDLYSFKSKCDDPKGGKYVWLMKLESYDISLKIEWIDEKNGTKEKIVDSKKISQNEGTFEAKSTGHLLITFDNSYSYFRSKDVHFGVVFHPSSGGKDVMSTPAGRCVSPAAKARN